MACGFAQNFAQLVLCRVGVGVGEAGCTPPAHSLITDYTPREKRASALAFYALGTPLGGLFGMALGGDGGGCARLARGVPAGGRTRPADGAGGALYADRAA